MTTAEQEIVDVFVIGGGINGVGVARDAIGRGYSVCLCEANDLASGTSSASSKLIHGGLRYLEYFEFGLVRKALKEREVLLNMAPHIISPMRFILPYSKGLRPWWLLRIGLFLYDHMGWRKILAGTRNVNLTKDPAGTPLQSNFLKGFEYSDCWVDDARLVVLNAVDAAQMGAEVKVRTKVEKAERIDGVWHVTFRDTMTGEKNHRRTRVLVNAAGPWVDDVLNSALFQSPITNTKQQNVRLVRGSHIVVPSLFDTDQAYIFQNADGRIIFAIPFEENFTLIGTTDVDHHGPLDEIKISDDEREYLCACASEYFKQVVKPKDIVWAYSGVRPLYDDGATEAQGATRDYVIETETKNGASLINIFGGKITTYRRLAEVILEHVESFLGKRGNPWTDTSSLSGGEFHVKGRAALADKIHTDYPFLGSGTAHRLIRLYGTNAATILNGATSVEQLGQHFGCGLYQSEVEYLIDNEWALSAEDILFRRTKIGITIADDDRRKLEAFVSKRVEQADKETLQQSI